MTYDEETKVYALALPVNTDTFSPYSYWVPSTLKM